jgi:Tfp pilus assembly protein PilE
LKTTLIALVVVLAIVAAIVGTRIWRGTVTRAEYQPTPAFTIEDQTFAQNAYDALVTAKALDDSFKDRCHTPDVCALVSTARQEHRQAMERLRSAVSTIDSRFEFLHGLNPVPEERQALKKGEPGVKLDRRYLDVFIREHERAQTMLDQAPSIEKFPSLARFANLWRADLDRHLANAQQLVNELPDAASSLPLMLGCGVLSLIASASLHYTTRYHRRRSPTGAR